MTQLFIGGTVLGLIGSIWFGWKSKMLEAELANERARSQKAEEHVALLNAKGDDESRRSEQLLKQYKGRIADLEKTRDANETEEQRLDRARTHGAGGSLLPGASQK